MFGSFGGGNEIYTGDIPASLRFRSGNYMVRTPGGSDSRRLITLSMWVKRCALGVFQRPFGADDIGSTTFVVGFNTNNKLEICDYAGSYLIQGISTQVFRDTTSWIHLVVAFDTNQTAFANAVKAYVNGVQITAWDTSTYSGAHDMQINDTRKQSFGVYLAGGVPTAPYDYGLDYLARPCLVTGSQLTPSSFGYFNPEINEWVSKSQSAVKAVVDAGGTNSFMLDFDNGTSLTTLGYDKSSKGNHWTLNNFSLTAGPTYDWMLDVPGNSYCTMSPIDQYLTGETDGNLKVTTNVGGYAGAVRGTATCLADKWYWEMTVLTNGVGAGQCPIGGIYKTDNQINTNWNSYGYYGYSGNKQAYTNGSLTTNAAYGATFTVNDVVGIAFDAIAGTLTFYKNGTSQGQAFSGITGNWSPVVWDPSTGGSVATNFGQRPFAYTPPTGFKALCQANMPDPAILNPEQHFDVLLHTGGASSAQDVAGAQFQPDLAWIKDRSVARSHGLFDSIRGATAYLASELTAAESVRNGQVFLSNGFRVDRQSGQETNTNGETYIDWLWKAGGTNIYNTSNQLTQPDIGSWTTSAVVTANTDVAPDGTTTADTINDNSGAQYLNIFSDTVPLTQNRRACVSMYIKKDSTGCATRFPAVRLYTSTGGYADTYIDTNTGATTYAYAGSLTGVASGKIDAGSYWLVYVSAYDTGAGVTWCRADLYPAIGAHASIGSGLGPTITGSVVAWGGKIEYDASITSQISANPTAGFSIVSYTGNLSAVGTATISHGLGKAPSLIISKSRNNAGGDIGQWVFRHQALDVNSYMRLNTSDALINAAANGSMSAPTSTVFSTNWTSGMNTNGATFVAYCFTDIAGYSKAFWTTGNGSVDGPYIHLGFRPKFILLKTPVAGALGVVMDTTRNTYNVLDASLWPSSSAAENTTYTRIDVTSQGFKIRSFNDNVNYSGYGIIGIAFADVPAKYALAR